jgi:hypothetical protein
MKIRETVTPYLVQEVDYAVLHQVIEQAFVEAYGADMIENVRVAHFNPDVIDATVIVRTRQPEMDSLVLEITEALRREGIRVAIRIQKHQPAEDN